MSERIKVMGYCASGNGDIKPKKEEDFDKILEIIDRYNVFDEVYVLYIGDDHKDTINVEKYSNSRYYEEDVFEFYREIADLVEKAEITFCGEDDRHWQHVCKDGVWQELTGEIVYKDPVEIARPKEQEAEGE